MGNKIKIAILDMYDNVPNEGMRCLKIIVGRFLSKEGIVGNYDIFNVRGNNELPSLDYDIFISSGGPGSPLETDEKWESSYFELLKNIVEHNNYSENKKYIFAICHSFQLLARFFEVGKISKRRSTSFGVMPIHRTELGFNEVLFNDLQEIFYAVDSRDYQLTELNLDKISEINAQVLCIEKERPHIPLERAIMAIRYSNEIFSTQFHPEADSEGMLRYFLRDDKKQAVINEHGEAKYFEMIDRMDDPDKILLTEAVLIPQFLENAYSKITQEVLELN